MANLDALMSTLQASKKLINMDSSGKLDQIAEEASKSGKLSFNDEAQTQSMKTPKKELSVPQTPIINESVVKKSKLPKAIIESMKKKPLVNAAHPYSTEGSFLDQLDSLTNGKLYENLGEKKETVKENIVQAKQVVNTTTTNGVDYSIIKSIVEESMRKYASHLKKTILNESKQVSEQQPPLQLMKIGKTFNFVDNKGNLYEAQLKFVKNIRNKK